MAILVAEAGVDTIVEDILPGQEQDQRLDDDSGQTSITEAGAEHLIGQNGGCSDPAGADGATERRCQADVDDLAGFRLRVPPADCFEDQDEHGTNQHAGVEQHNQLVLDGEPTPAALGHVGDADDALIERYEEKEQPLEEDVRPENVLDDTTQQSGAHQDVSGTGTQKKQPARSVVQWRRGGYPRSCQEHQS